MALTEKQKKFADQYLIDLNATQAAIRAGYSKKTAEQMGHKLVKNSLVSKYIQKRQKSLQERTEITQEKVIAELVSIGFAEATDFAFEGVPINPKANYKGSSKIRALELVGKHLGLFNDKAEKDPADLINGIQSLADILRSPVPNRGIPEDDE